MNLFEVSALDYAARGWPVLPLHSAKDGRCSCGRPDCDSPGKHPRTLHGLKDATTGAKTIESWWRTWPDANIGILTGAPSGLIVLDVDPRHGGDATLDDLLAAHGPLPDTVESLTGGGGRHIFFRHPGGTVRNSNGELGPGLDMKGDGGYIVAPPSVHVSGKSYQWELSSDPGEVSLADAPHWLLALLQDTPAPAAAVSQGGRIVDGQRNTTLASLAGSMRRRGMTEAAILAALQADNRARCAPPLPDDEVAAIAKSIGRYPSAPAEAKAKNAKQADAPMTDLGNAQRFARRAVGQARYCAQWGKWIIWRGTRWKVDDALDILSLAKRTALSIFDEAKTAADPARQKALATWAVKSQSRYSLAALVDLARPDLAVNVEALDADPFALNVLNGVVDLRSGELRPHTPDDLLTRLAPVHYDPVAKCPLWDAFLDRIMARNAALIGYLQKLAGICMTADISEQILPMLFGGGANGKTVLMDTLTGLMGDYAGEAPPDLLLMRSNPEHPTEIADLCGRRLVVASETDEGRRLRVQLVKRLTGNSRLKARYMRGDYFEFPRTHKLILATNNRPIIKETTLAIWRRIQLVPFSVTIPLEEQDRHLTDKLAGERSGILNWAIEGCLAWQRDGLDTPIEVLAATADYQAEQDPLAEFFDTCCTFAATAEAPRADLFERYATWAERSKDHHPLDRPSFFERIRRRPGVDETRRRIDGRLTRLFTGIGLANVELFSHEV